MFGRTSRLYSVVALLTAFYEFVRSMQVTALNAPKVET